MLKEETSTQPGEQQQPSLCGWDYYYSHFDNEEAEGQRGQVRSPQSHSQEVVGPGFQPRPPVLLLLAGARTGLSWSITQLEAGQAEDLFRNTLRYFVPIGKERALRRPELSVQIPVHTQSGNSSGH